MDADRIKELRARLEEERKEKIEFRIIDAFNAIKASGKMEFEAITILARRTGKSASEIRSIVVGE